MSFDAERSGSRLDRFLKLSAAVMEMVFDACELLLSAGLDLPDGYVAIAGMEREPWIGVRHLDTDDIIGRIAQLPDGWWQAELSTGRTHQLASGPLAAAWLINETNKAADAKGGE